MLSKYGDSVYEVIKILKNSLEIVDKNNYSIRVKKSDVLKVKPTGLTLPETSVIEKANNEHSTEIKLKKEGIDPKNILSKPRKKFSFL